VPAGRSRSTNFRGASGVSLGCFEKSEPAVFCQVERLRNRSERERQMQVARRALQAASADPTQILGAAFQKLRLGPRECKILLAASLPRKSKSLQWPRDSQSPAGAAQRRYGGLHRSPNRLEGTKSTRS